MLGQEKLLTLIDSFDLDTLPRSIILVGEYGSGKHSVVKYIQDSLKLNSINITKSLNLQTIIDINEKPTPCIYFIECNSISEKEQNTILKLIEEPLRNAYIILLSENKYSLLPTVLNRCQVFELAPYSKEILTQFISSTCDESLLLEIGKTPGQIKELQSYNIKEIIDLGNKIFDKIKVANFANILTISNKLSFKDEKDKINFDIFINVLLYCIKEKITLNTESNYNVYTLTKELCSNSHLPNINKKYLFENYLTNLKLIKR